MIDRIKELNSSNQSDVLAKLISMGLEARFMTLMDTDGKIIWKRDEVNELEKAKEYMRQALIMYASDAPQQTKDEKYGKIMTEMERTYRIAQIASNDHVPREIMHIYKKISGMRLTLK